MNSGTLDPTYQDPNPDVFFTSVSNVGLSAVDWLGTCSVPVRSHLVSLPVQSHTVPYSQIFSEQDNPGSFLGWEQDLPTDTLAAEDS